VNLIIDENLPPSWTHFLTQAGFPATHWKDIGNIGDPDEVIFDYASKHESVIVTQDLDFTRILALRGANLPSIIQLRVQCAIPQIIGQALLDVLRMHHKPLLTGCLISLDLNRHRLRLLPLN
jgi:predicted nuclease of predicted toxin-antitoxin system